MFSKRICLLSQGLPWTSNHLVAIVYPVSPPPLCRHQGTGALGISQEKLSLHICAGKARDLRLGKLEATEIDCSPLWNSGRWRWWWQVFHQGYSQPPKWYLIYCRDTHFGGRDRKAITDLCYPITILLDVCILILAILLNYIYVQVFRDISSQNFNILIYFKFLPMKSQNKAYDRSIREKHSL